jgi:hypothetical protein
MGFAPVKLELVTTDKLAAYEQAIAKYFDKIHYAYLQIVKQRRKRILIKVKKKGSVAKKLNRENIPMIN